MEKCINKEGLLDTLHTLYTQAKIIDQVYIMWFLLNNKTFMSVITAVMETEATTIFISIGQGSLGAAYYIYKYCVAHERELSTIFSKYPHLK